MPPRVTYWTGTWDPAKEAISKEVTALRIGTRSRAPVVAFSSGHPTRLQRGSRVLQISGRSWPLLRIAAALIERRGDVTHIFGGPGSWHPVRALGRRPIVFTAVVSRALGDQLPHTRFARVVVETETSIAEWTGIGVPRARVEIIRPGIDLDRFRVDGGRGADRFTLLFASTPADPTEIEPRGIGLLIELARARPDIDILVPWRQWGDVDAARRVLGSWHPPDNFQVTHQDSSDMREWYARAHATVVCFDSGVGKTCPNFVLEGLACGLPCLATRETGLGALLTTHAAGVTVPREIEALSRAIDNLREALPAFRDRARALAEAEFSLARFRARYEQVYDDVAAGG